MPDPDRPSGAPLSESEADRLSERFTASWDEPASWEEPEPPTLEPVTVPKAGPPLAATPAPAIVPVAAPAAAPAPALTLAKPKQTLLGIAPIVVVGPSQPPAAPAVAAPVAPAP